MPLDNAQEYANVIPEAVRRQAARAEEIARSIGAAPQPEGEGAPAAPEGTPAAEQVTEPVIADGGTIVAPAAPPAPATPAAPAAPTVDWEQRYRTLQGKYDSEIPRLTGQVESLQQIISGMQERRPEPTPAPAAPPAQENTTVVVPQEDVETYGEELVSASRRWARAEVAKEIADLRNEITQLRGAQQQTAQMTTQEHVLNALDNDPSLTGKWRQVNEDPQFIAWLNQVDPFTGQQRKVLLRDAFSRGDVNRTGAFFKAYLAEHTAVTQDPPPAPPIPPEPGAGRPSLEDLAAPGRASGPAPAGAPAEKRIWSNQDISAFYRDVRRGVYEGREAEKLRLEQDIFAATTEGRIR